MRSLCGLTLVCILAGQTLAQPQAGSFPPSREVLVQLHAKRTNLGRAIETLRQRKVEPALLADVEVYLRAAAIMERNQDYHFEQSAAWTLEVLDTGMSRAQSLSQGQAPWAEPGRRAIRAYRSRIDGSLQPYVLALPAEKSTGRLDVVLHGRNNTLTEVGFLRSHADGFSRTDHPVLEVFGRGNNAYRWAGEVDVFEAIESFRRHEARAGRAADHDPRKVVLRGFSMGGAGTWHLGLHYPDRWCVLGPSAGFTNTMGLPKPYPPTWTESLRIYDAVDYAPNVFMVPVVAYSGEADPQKAAADNIEARLQPLGLKMTHFVAPKTGHVFTPEYQKKAEALWAARASTGREPYPAEVRFTTYTLKYPRCEWVEILRLHKHYELTNVTAAHDAGRLWVRTANVAELKLQMPPKAGEVQVHIDAQDLPPVRGDSVTLVNREGRWEVKGPAQAGLAKLHGLQGPIDDAFTQPFLCVVGTGKPWHSAAQAYAEADVKRFGYEWSKYLRGDFPLKKDTEVTQQDIENHNLILFGDPGSNALIAKVLDRLPLRWTRDKLEMSGKSYASAEHVPAMIFPNPLAPKRYVVLNSGHTFHEAQFKATNAYLFPRLGDWAVLRLDANARDPLSMTPVDMGLFDEQWGWSSR